MKRMILFAAALGAAVLSAAAQGAPSWAEVEYAVGKDITVIRDGQPIAVAEPIGLRLMEGDHIQTGKGTFLEIRLMPSGGTLKLSENTAFILSSISSPSERSFKILYGRVRAKVEKLAASHSFNIHSDSVAAGVRGTDFGYDVLTSRASGSDSQKPITRVYCFEGSVAVHVLQTSGPDTVPKEYALSSGTMVTVEEKDGGWTPELTPLTEDVRSFWRENDFVSSASMETGSPPVSSTLSLPTYASARAALRVKNAAVFGGIVLVGLGSVLQGVGAYSYAAGDPVLGLNAVVGGAFMGIISLPVLVFGLSKNPVLTDEP